MTAGPHLSPAGIRVLHDYFTQRGGAERVAVLLARRFGGGTFTTSAVILERTFPEVTELSPRTLLPRIPAALLRHRAVLGPLAGLAFLGHAVDFGVALCSSSGWSHWIRGAASRVVYCHTPARWLYEPDDYFGSLSHPLRRLLNRALTPLRAIDRRRMASATVLIANGPVTAERIRRAYGIEPRVIVPPPGMDPAGPQDPVPGVDAGFYLVISRPRGYKNLDLVTAVFAHRPDAQLVVVGGSPGQRSSGNVLELGRVSDAQLRWLYSHARAVVCVAYEDLGLVPLEAFQFGTPAIALRAGGYLATCTEGVNTVFVEALDASSLACALDAFAHVRFDAEAIRASAVPFGLSRFEQAILAVIDEVRSGDRRADRDVHGGMTKLAVGG